VWWVEELQFTRHKFLLVAVKEWLKSVLDYRSYPKNKTGYPFLDHPVYLCYTIISGGAVKSVDSKIYRVAQKLAHFLYAL